MRGHPVLSLAAAVFPLMGGAPSWGDQGADLQVTNVTLFSSGVGFFQREARVTDAATARLQFRTEQVNDILKSLVVQDLDGGSVGVVSYASQDPLEKTLASFGVDLTDNPSLGDLLGQLRGEAVEITGPRQIRGTILGVETREVAVEKEKIEKEYLNLLTDSGLQQLDVSTLGSIKVVNEKISAELNQALAALAAGHDAGKRTVRLQFNGQGQRRVRASFLLETPIWKTSYRLVLGSDQKPFLQGWAIVENATQEDWKDVKLSLVSGRPISFRMDLYTPLYLPRPVEEMELYASLRPPTYEGGFGGGGFGGAMEEGEAGRLAKGVPARSAMGRRARAVAPAAKPAQPAAPAAEESRSERVDMADAFFSMSGVSRGIESVAAAQQAGELFQYLIQTPVSIARQNSAMLPIVNQAVGGEKVSIYNPGTHPKHPLSGLMLENSTDLHLMQGPITVFDGGVYAGDAKLPDLRAGEKRLVAYALDLGVELLVESKPHENELVSVRIEKGTFWHRRRNVDERVYQIKNKDDRDRTVLIEQPSSPEWKLIEPKEPFERAENLLRFRVAAPAGKTVSQTVRLERVAAESVALTDLNFDAIQIYLRQPVTSPAVKEALQKVISLRNELDQAVRERTGLEQQVKEAVDEQARIRENVKTLDRTTDAYKRQLKKFDDLETAIESHRAKLTSARQNEEGRKRALEGYLLSLTIE